MNIIEVSNKFINELDTTKYFESVRWGKNIRCAYCNSNQISSRNNDDRFHCKNCNKSFSVTTNTLLHNTRLPLQ